MLPRPSCWGRYEGVFLWLGSVVEEFVLAERSLRFEFRCAEAAWDCLSREPGPLAAALREASRERYEEAKRNVLMLVARFGETRADGSVSIPVGYGVTTGIRMFAPSSRR